MTAPPPWTLYGDGLVLVAHFPEAFVREHCFLADFQQTGYRGWVGTVMLVDYKTSNVGPYRELLFIPGLFSIGGKTTFSISKIYVSTQVSVDNGIETWGIPKEQADFDITHEPDGSTTYTVSQQGKPFFTVRATSDGLSFPVSTRLLPGFQVTQKRQGEMLLTAPTATGKGQLARLHNIQIDPSFFPDITQGTRLATIAASDFTMVFPVPEAINV